MTVGYHSYFFGHDATLVTAIVFNLEIHWNSVTQLLSLLKFLALYKWNPSMIPYKWPVMQKAVLCYDIATVKQISNKWMKMTCMIAKMLSIDIIKSFYIIFRLHYVMFTFLLGYQCSTQQPICSSQMDEIMLETGKKFCYHIGIVCDTFPNLLKMGMRTGAIKSLGRTQDILQQSHGLTTCLLYDGPFFGNPV